MRRMVHEVEPLVPTVAESSRRSPTATVVRLNGRQCALKPVHQISVNDSRISMWVDTGSPCGRTPEIRVGEHEFSR